MNQWHSWPYSFEIKRVLSRRVLSTGSIFFSALFIADSMASGKTIWFHAAFFSLDRRSESLVVRFNSPRHSSNSASDIFNRSNAVTDIFCAAFSPSWYLSLILLYMSSRSPPLKLGQATQGFKCAGKLFLSILLRLLRVFYLSTIMSRLW